MTSKFEQIANQLQAMHDEYVQVHGKRDAEKLGSKSLVAAFRLAVKYRTPVPEILNFVEQTEHNAANKSTFTNRYEFRLKRDAVRPRTRENLRIAIGEGIKGGADAAWDALIHAHNARPKAP